MISVRKLFKTFIISFFLLGFSLASMAQDSLLQAGPMVGYTEMMETSIWVQTKQPAEVAVNYWPKGKVKKFMLGGSKQTKKDHSNVVEFILSNLKPGTQYEYKIFIDGEEVNTPYPTEFKTQELWQWRTDPPAFTVALGSCLYINDKPYDRPGKPYGGDPSILKTIAQKNPDVMLWMGDNIYYREPDFYSATRLDYRYRDGREIPEMQPLLASTVNLAIWDDHDYGPNNSDRSFRKKNESLKLFKRYWANPKYGTRDTPGVFFRYKYSDAEFFMLDDRYYRAPDDLKDPDKPYLGQKQLQWLEDGLADSYATFKFIVIGNQATNKMAGSEAYTNYPHEYNELMDFLKKQKIEGVVFLSGDRHFTELLKKDRKNFYPIYEFTSSPLTSGTFSTLDQTKEFHNPQRVDGTLVYKKRSFGLLKINGKKGNRTLVMQAFDKKGNKLWEYQINEDELKID